MRRPPDPAVQSLAPSQGGLRKGRQGIITLLRAFRRQLGALGPVDVKGKSVRTALKAANLGVASGVTAFRARRQS